MQLFHIFVEYLQGNMCGNNNDSEYDKDIKNDYNYYIIIMNLRKVVILSTINSKFKIRNVMRSTAKNKNK